MDIPGRDEWRDEVTCNVRDVLGRVGDKWSLNVIYLLADGPKRFTELKREIEGISQRMLTVTVRGLERDGLVQRTVYAVVPPRVEYALTPLGLTLLDSVKHLMTWTLDHVHDIDLARKTFDARTADTDLQVRRMVGRSTDAEGSPLT
jgi:DNA-binding HxlR family transcriptional regulator